MKIYEKYLTERNPEGTSYSELNKPENKEKIEMMNSIRDILNELEKKYKETKKHTRKMRMILTDMEIGK